MSRKRLPRMLESPKENLSAKCITDKYGNFKKDKIYPAHSRFQKLSGVFSGFLVTDEDGDNYTLTEDCIHRVFELVDP